MSKFLLPLSILCTLTLSSLPALAWGGKGHHLICQAATQLVKEPGLKEFMRLRPQVMGHLCNVPDIYWKSLGADVNKIGSPTHWIDPEVIGLSLKDIPSKYKSIVNKFTGKQNKFETESTLKDIPGTLGSVWWRTNQFFERSVSAGKDAKKAKPPVEKSDEQNYDLPYNKAVYEFMVNAGVMGHFVGDASQPFHVTADHDGQKAGHKGIHSYYEDFIVAYQGENLETKVVELAKSMKSEKFLKGDDVIERMRQLTLLSWNEIEPVLKLDIFETPKEGMAPFRPNAEIDAPKYTQLITLQMARSAALLASLWELAYSKAGKPEVKYYRAYKYPFTPDFVAPDYL